MKKFIFLFVFIFVSITTGEIKAEDRAVKAIIYNGQGGANESAIEIGKILKEVGISFFFVKEVSSHTLAGIDILIFSDGWAHFIDEIDHEGIEAIREFVNKGGAYVGICAGAYFAAKDVLWNGKEYSYPLGLFKGKAVGPLFPDWTEERTILIQTDKKRIFVSYMGGPYFLPENNKVIVLAEYVGGKADGKPAALIVTYGDGRIFLCGPHLEYSGKTAKEWFKRVLRLLIGGRY